MGETMNNTSKDAGVIQALVERLQKIRLPRLNDIKERVDKGEVLDESDMSFLEEVLEDTQHVEPLLERNPEWQPLAASVVALYKDITDKALENEKKS